MVAISITSLSLRSLHFILAYNSLCKVTTFSLIIIYYFVLILDIYRNPSSFRQKRVYPVSWANDLQDSHGK